MPRSVSIIKYFKRIGVGFPDWQPSAFHGLPKNLILLRGKVALVGQPTHTRTT